MATRKEVLQKVDERQKWTNRLRVLHGRLGGWLLAPRPLPAVTHSLTHLPSATQ